MRMVHWLFVVSVALFVSGIGFVVAAGRSAPQAAAEPEAPPMVAVGSIKQIMAGITGPSATVVYNAVGTIINSEGIKEIAPQNDEEWAVVANGAAALVESGNLLLIGESRRRQRGLDYDGTRDDRQRDGGAQGSRGQEHRAAFWRPVETSMQRVTTAMPSISVSRYRVAFATLVAVACACSVGLEAHGVSGKDAVFLQGLQGQAIGPLMYLGAKHMVTGYDHLLFLVGVIFFLYRLKDVVAVRQPVHASGTA